MCTCNLFLCALHYHPRGHIIRGFIAPISRPPISLPSSHTIKQHQQTNFKWYRDVLPLLCRCRFTCCSCTSRPLRSPFVFPSLFPSPIHLAGDKDNPRGLMKIRSSTNNPTTYFQSAHRSVQLNSDCPLSSILLPFVVSLVVGSISTTIASPKRQSAGEPP